MIHAYDGMVPFAISFDDGLMRKSVKNAVNLAPTQSPQSQDSDERYTRLKYGQGIAITNHIELCQKVLE